MLVRKQRHLEMKEKTLTILIGNARGGEKTWNSMYENLLNPYESDLALCFGEVKDKSSSLYKRSKYVWELPEYNNWRDYYSNVCNGNWEKTFYAGNHVGLSGGIDDLIGSGAIGFAFRHFIKNNKKQILEQYDRIILTRSDYYYAYKQEVLVNDYLWIVEGEDYLGVCDRMHIFPSTLIDNVLGIVEYMDSAEGYNDVLNLECPNVESVLKSYFNYSGVSNIIKRFLRFNYTVSVEGDTTRWAPGIREDPNNTGLFIKYGSEYELCMKNISDMISVLDKPL